MCGEIGQKLCFIPESGVGNGLGWGYAQRNSSLWNPIVEAIASGLVRESACRCFCLYLLVLRGTDRRDGFYSYFEKGGTARSPVVGVKPDNPLAFLVEEMAAQGGQRGRRINRRPHTVKNCFKG